MKPVAKIWMNGALVDWADAKIHILSHVIQYGSGWFEGIRAYETKRGTAIFRLQEHLRRMHDSCKIYRVEIPYTLDQLKEAIIETIKANGLKACYIRPLVYRGYGDVGVDPSGIPIDVAIAVWEWGSYLGAGALANGIDVRLSSWHRAAPDTFPTYAKSTGNYLNSQLIRLEAAADGYAEGIALDAYGYVSEGSGENIFMVRDRILFTPPLTRAVLPGITRMSLLRIAKDAGYEVHEVDISREMLYIADELFFCGTAAEITPIRSIDRILIGDGKPGPITLDLQKRFFEIVRDGEDPYQWLTFVE
ncbi:MAG: branched-chain amino acid transaminase [Bacteroidota bacterium]